MSRRPQTRLGPAGEIAKPPAGTRRPSSAANRGASFAFSTAYPWGSEQGRLHPKHSLTTARELLEGFDAAAGPRMGRPLPRFVTKSRPHHSARMPRPSRRIAAGAPFRGRPPTWTARGGARTEAGRFAARCSRESRCARAVEIEARSVHVMPKKRAGPAQQMRPSAARSWSSLPLTPVDGNDRKFVPSAP